MTDLTLPETPYLRTTDAGRYLKLSGRTLEKHRVVGTGLRYCKIGGRVVYSLDDLDAWAQRGFQVSTHDKGAGQVRPARRPLDDGART